MIEAEGMAEFVDHDGFEVVCVRIHGQRRGSRKRRGGVAGQEKCVRVQDLTNECGGYGVSRKLLANDVRRNDARERENSECEAGIILIEADGVESVGG